MASPLKQRVVASLLVFSAAGISLLQGREGREYTAYQDTASVWTICDGHTKGVKKGDKATDAICDALLQQDTAEAQATVRRLVKVPVTQEQYDALVDFTYNCGSGNFASSTLLKKVNANECKAAGAEFPKWNKAGGVVLRGLTIRRDAERKLWESGCE